MTYLHSCEVTTDALDIESNPQTVLIQFVRLRIIILAEDDKVTCRAVK